MDKLSGTQKIQKQKRPSAPKKPRYQPQYTVTEQCLDMRLLAMFGKLHGMVVKDNMSDETILQAGPDDEFALVGMGVKTTLKALRDEAPPDEDFRAFVTRKREWNIGRIKTKLLKEKAREATWRESCASGKCKHGWCIQQRAK